MKLLEEEQARRKNLERREQSLDTLTRNQEEAHIKIQKSLENMEKHVLDTQR